MAKDVHAGMYERFAAEGVQVEGWLNFEALGTGLCMTDGAEGTIQAALKETQNAPESA